MSRSHDKFGMSGLVSTIGQCLYVAVDLVRRFDRVATSIETSDCCRSGGSACVMTH